MTLAKTSAAGPMCLATDTAVARELVGFIWAVGVQAEREAATA